ncbi:trigger factor [Aciduricibacillus chroicocephali]|uniref:Trigger factor n=1 Tax=Aciduricibacillus chroicocephali TaxID=3054939 RepID=A0ABY9KT19_9BACI|nr:trigger factor [Bacillaceae bacterium 44XB]
MSAKFEKQEGNVGVLTFEVSSERFEEALDTAFNKVVKQVSVPGFRKGKMPRGMFEKRFGVESLYQDAIDAVLPSAYPEAVKEAGIEPVDQPSIDVEEIERGKGIVFKAEVTVKPEVELGEYKGLEVEVESVEVTDEEVDQAIDQVRNQQAELVVKEEGEIVEGDTAVIDFEGFHNGEAFEGGKGDNYSLEIGSGQFIPGFEEQLVGKKSGEDTEVKVTFPEDYHETSLAGQEATFKVHIHEIKEKEVPELDDEFAKDQDAESVADLKAKTREKLEADKKQAAENAKREALLEQATDNAKVDIPEAMVETETDRMVQEFEQRLQMQGMTLDLYTQFSGQSVDDLRGQMKENASERVKTNLVLEAIFEQENLEVSDEDANKELEQMAEMYQTDVEQLKAMLGGNTEMIKEDLKYRKAIEFLDEQSKTK